MVKSNGYPEKRHPGRFSKSVEVILVVSAHAALLSLLWLVPIPMYATCMSNIHGKSPSKKVKRFDLFNHDYITLLSCTAKCAMYC